MSPDHLDTVIYWSNTRVSGTLSCHVVRVHHFVHGVYTWGGGGFSGGLIFGWSLVEMVNCSRNCKRNRNWTSVSSEYPTVF